MSKLRIPCNLEDCFEVLNGIFSPESIKAIKNNEIYDNFLHHGMGMSLRNLWGLEETSVLKDWFNDHDVWFADDMVKIIFESYKRYLNNQPVNLEEQIEDYKKLLKIEVELDGPLDAESNVPEGLKFVSFDVKKRNFDLITAGWLIFEIARYGAGTVTIITTAKKIYDYFRNKKSIKSVKINGKEVNPKDKKEIAAALENWVR